MMKFQNKTIQCGYHGTKLLKEVKVGTKTVCSSVLDDSVYFPQSPPYIYPQPAGTQFEVLLRSPVLVSYTPEDIMDSGSSNSWSTWHFQPYSNDDTGYWYSLTCSSAVSTFRMKTISAFTEVIVTKSKSGTSFKNTSFYKAFLGLSKLRSGEFTENMGYITNFTDIFSRNASVEYVKFHPKHFGITKQFHGIFYRCYNLKYVTYFDTSRHAQGSNDFNRTSLFTHCDKLVRPSAQEITLLSEAWGGKTAYNFSDRFMGVKSLQLYTTRTHYNNFVTLGDILFFDDNGNKITATCTPMNEAAVSGHESNYLLDDNVNTYWQSSGNVPEKVWFNFNSAVKISQIRMRARTNQSWSHPLDFIWRTDPNTIAWNANVSYIKNQTINMPVDWMYTEWRSVLIDPV